MAHSIIDMTKIKVRICWKAYGTTIHKSKFMTEEEAVQRYKEFLEDICTTAWLQNEKRIIYKWLKRPGSL